MNTITKTKFGVGTKIVIAVAVALGAGGLALATIPSFQNFRVGVVDVSSAVSIAPRNYAPGATGVEIGRMLLAASDRDVYVDEINLAGIKEGGYGEVMLSSVFSSIKIVQGGSQVGKLVQPSSLEDKYGTIDIHLDSPYVIPARSQSELIIYGDVRKDAKMDGASNQLTIFFSYRNKNAQKSNIYTTLQAYSLQCGDEGQRACPPGQGYGVSYCLRNKNLTVDTSGFCSPICPAGTTLLVTGECSAGIPITTVCANGLVKDSTGNCIKQTNTSNDILTKPIPIKPTGPAPKRGGRGRGGIGG